MRQCYSNVDAGANFRTEVCCFFFPLSFIYKPQMFNSSTDSVLTEEYLLEEDALTCTEEVYFGKGLSCCLSRIGV